MKRILFLTLALLIAVLAGCKKDKEKKDDNSLPTPTYQDTVSIDTVAPLPFEEEPDTTATVMKEDSTGNLQPVEHPVKPEENQKIYVIVGSFKNYANAQKKLNQLQNLGYTESIILPKVGEYHRVAVAGYDDEATARKALKEFRIKFRNNKIWLLLR